MPKIDSSIIIHRLNINPTHKSVIQKRQSLNPKCYTVINEEVQKLLTTKFIREVRYPEWLANVVMVKKLNGKWRIYINYTNLNKACPKHSLSIVG